MRYLAMAVLVCSTALWAANEESNLPQLPSQQVVARVNGVELHGDTLNDYVEAVYPDFSFHGKVQPDKINEYRRAALDRMVLHELIYQEGVRRHLVVPPAKVDAEIALMQGRFRSPEAFQHGLSKRGLSLDALRAQIVRSEVIAAVVRQDVSSHLAISDQQVRAVYQRNLARFHEPATVHIRHIFIRPGPDANTLANHVHALAVAKNTSEEFDQLATRYSQDDYRVMGGDLGWVHRGRLEPELEEAAFTLRPGQLGLVIRTSTGFHLLRVEGKRPARLVPFLEVRKSIRDELIRAKKKRLSDSLRARVYSHANVELVAKF